MNKRELQRMLKAALLYAMVLPFALLLMFLIPLSIIVLCPITYGARMRRENTPLVRLLELIQILWGLLILGFLMALPIVLISWQFGLMLDFILVGCMMRRFIIPKLKAGAWIIYKFQHRLRNRN